MSHTVDQKYVERFYSYVGEPDSEGCMLWLGTKITSGYGQLATGGRKARRTLGAHRLSWMIANDSEIPDGKVVMHSCDNPSCVNPEHLSLGTPKQNSEDMVSKGRWYSGNTSRFSPEDLKRMRLLKTFGKKLKEIAEEFDCSEAMISKLLSGSVGHTIKEKNV